MQKNMRRKILSVAFIIGSVISMNACTFTEKQTDESMNDNLVISEVPQQTNSEQSTGQNLVAPCERKTVTEPNTQYLDSHDAKFTFTVAANVGYSDQLGRYVISDITPSRPGILPRNGANATADIPTYQMIDGNRHAQINTTATIQNKTGWSSRVKLTMYLYCNSKGDLILQQTP